MHSFSVCCLINWEHACESVQGAKRTKTKNQPKQNASTEFSHGDVRVYLLEQVVLFQPIMLLAEVKRGPGSF